MSVLETPFPAALSGSISTKVVDFHDPGTPQTIIETDDDWRIDVQWNLSGPLAPFICGEFYVQAYLEDIAATQFEGPIGAKQVVDVSSAPATTNRQYQRHILIKAGAVPTGVYKLTTVLTYSNLGVPLEMAGFDEGPMLQLYSKVGSNP
jgi:hypothetical protein